MYQSDMNSQEVVFGCYEPRFGDKLDQEALDKALEKLMKFFKVYEYTGKLGTLNTVSEPPKVYDMDKCGQGSSSGRCHFLSGTFRGTEMIDGVCSLLRHRTMEPLTLETSCRVQALSNDSIQSLMQFHQDSANSSINAAHASLEYRRTLDDLIYLRTVHGVKQTTP